MDFSPEMLVPLSGAGQRLPFLVQDLSDPDKGPQTKQRSNEIMTALSCRPIGPACRCQSDERLSTNKDIPSFDVAMD